MARSHAGFALLAAVIAVGCGASSETADEPPNPAHALAERLST